MKILIYFNKNELKPVGGPSGYLYNLEKNLDNNIYNFLDFPVKEKKYNLEKMKIPFFLKKYLRNISWRFKSWKNLNKEDTRINQINIDEYDAIHFHKTSDLFKCRVKLANYKGKIILTSHCPKAPYLEVCEDFISKLEYKLHKKFYQKLEKIDIYAFSKCDYIIFPCKEAEEPYYNTWEWYCNNKKNLDYKKKYVPTGIIKKHANMKKNDIRKKLNIPQDAFICMYVGRHSEVKGYPKFLKLWDYYKNVDNVYFLCCGKKGDYDIPKNKRWIEIGWTNCASDYINAADLYILPNKETYFDLILLEVMSIGTPILASRTGGNKFFEKFENSGIMLFDDYDDMLKKIENIRANKSDLKKLRQNNIKLFDGIFNDICFSRNYDNLMKEIIKNEI